MNEIILERVYYMPKTLKDGVLYVSEEFSTAAHLCACGCGKKVRTPLGPAEWTLIVTDKGPTLKPSIGNWQFECKSHYWIEEGQFLWDRPWTSEQIEAGWKAEEIQRKRYYDKFDSQKISFLKRLWGWIKSLFSR